MILGNLFGTTTRSASSLGEQLATLSIWGGDVQRDRLTARREHSGSSAHLDFLAGLGCPIIMRPVVQIGSYTPPFDARVIEIDSLEDSRWILSLCDFSQVQPGQLGGFMDLPGIDPAPFLAHGISGIHFTWRFARAMTDQVRRESRGTVEKALMGWMRLYESTFWFVDLPSNPITPESVRYRLAITSHGRTFEVDYCPAWTVRAMKAPKRFLELARTAGLIANPTERMHKVMREELSYVLSLMLLRIAERRSTGLVTIEPTEAGLARLDRPVLAGIYHGLTNFWDRQYGNRR